MNGGVFISLHWICQLFLQMSESFAMMMQNLLRWLAYALLSNIAGLGLSDCRLKDTHVVENQLKVVVG